MKLQKDLVWGYYTEMRTHMRHAETLRATGLSIVFTVGSALLVVLGWDREVTTDEWGLCLALLLVGLFGSLFAVSYLARYHKSQQRADWARHELDRVYFHHCADAPIGLSAIETIADAYAASGPLRRLDKVLNTHPFWAFLPLALAVVGATLLGRLSS